MTRSNPGFHSVRFGDVTVTALNDGAFEGSTDLILGLPAERAEALLRDSHRVLPPRLTVSCLLLEWAGRVAVIDFGGGGAFGPLLGHAKTALAALGLSPDSVDHVLLSHGHIDHVGGLITDAAAAFPRASLHANAVELDHWTAPAADKEGYVETVRAVIAAYGERTQRFTAGQEVIPGVTSVALPGHTPGHTGFLIGSGAEKLFHWTDVVHLPGIQFAEPQAALQFDTDAEQARATRLKAFDMAATDRLTVAGCHLDFPLFGHVVRHGAAYAFEPLVWTPSETGLASG